MSERTALLASAPTAADPSPEARLDDQQDDHPSQQHVSGPPDDSTAYSRLSAWRASLAALSLALLIFLQATNVSIITTTYSDIADELQASELVPWFTSAYLMASSALGPLNGRLAIIFTSRNCIAVGSTIFAVGTFISGLAPHFSTFILGRAITGIGASSIFTVSIFVVLDLSSVKNRGLIMGLLNTGFTIGVAAGATVAGALLPSLGWRWLFIGQAPIAVLSGLTLYLAIPSNFTTVNRTSKPISTQLASLDYLGAISLTVTILLVLYALSSPKEIPLIPLLLSPVALAAFVLIELYLAADPFIPISLLKSRGLLLSCLATVGYMMARWSVLFYSPTYALALRGWSPVAAGSILIPTNAGFALGGLTVGIVHIRREGSFYIAALVAYTVFPLTLIRLASRMTADSNIALYILDLFICGFVTGAALNYGLAHVLHLTPKATHYIATSLLATFRGFSGSFGSAIGGGLFTRTLYASLTKRFAAEGVQKADLVRRLLGSPKLVQQLEGVDREIAMGGYADALQMLFQAAAILATLTIFVQAATGWRKAPVDDAPVVHEDEDHGETP